MMLIRLACITTVLCHSYAFREGSSKEAPPYHTRTLLFFPIFPHPKPFSIFSKPRPEEGESESPPDKKPDTFVSHVGNVLQGGSIGIEIRPLAPFQGILDHAKKIFPGHGTVGTPSHDEPNHPTAPHQPIPGHQQQKPGMERPHKPVPGFERPHQQHRPGHQRPRPQGHGGEAEGTDDGKVGGASVDEYSPLTEDGAVPSWEDIGEVEYGEGSLQPRLDRPKRFVDSKIYHVPLAYVSNGRAERVRRIRPEEEERSKNEK